MAQSRQLIRAKVAELIIAASTAASSRVYPSRVLPFRRAEVTPAILVYTPTESVVAQFRPRELNRTIDIIIDGHIVMASDKAVEIENALDALATEVEAVMHADEYLDGTVVGSVLKGVSIDAGEDDNDRLIGLVQLTYEAEYHTPGFVDAAPADDFNTVNSTQNLGDAVHVDEQAVDNITVQVP